MSFNFRVFKTCYDLKQYDFTEYSIKEVYYDDNGTIEGISSEPFSVVENTLDELKDTVINKLTKALELPVLTPKDIPNYKYSEREIPLIEG